MANSSLTRVSRLAETDIMADLVQTGGTVPAGPRHAFVHLNVAAFALESRHTEAGGPVPGAPADGAVAARIGGAMVHLFLAESPSVAFLTDARIPWTPVLHCQAAGTVATQLLSTALDTSLTVMPQHAWHALAS